MRPPERHIAIFGLVLVIGVWALVLLASSSTLLPSTTASLPTRAVLPTLPPTIEPAPPVAVNPTVALPTVAESPPTIAVEPTINVAQRIVDVSPTTVPTSLPPTVTTINPLVSNALPDSTAKLADPVLTAPDPADTTPPPLNADFANLIGRAQQTGQVDVIVKLNVGFTPEPLLRGQRIQAQRNMLRGAQTQLIRSLSTYNAQKIKDYQSFPFSAMRVDAAALQALRQSPLVAAVAENIRFEHVLTDSVPLIDAPDVWSMGYDGTGQVVAIIDSGVQSDHPFLSGQVLNGDGACFSTTGGIYLSLCPNGFDEEIGLNTGEACFAFVIGCDHGTHVGGIVAGNPGGGFSGYGVAPDAQILPIMASSAYICVPSPLILCSTFQLMDLISALDYVVAMSTTYDIAAVNMSLGGRLFGDFCDEVGAHQSDPRPDDWFFTDPFRTLALAGIVPVVASGNNGFSNGISSPACNSYALAVGSSTKSDRVSSFSNSNFMVDVLAPGSSIRSSVPGNAFATWNGTSMAAPHVAGALALLKEADTDATVSELYKALALTGLPIRDSRNNITRPRVDVDDALNILVAGGAAVPDDFSDATSISLFPFEVHEYTFFATDESGETDGNCTLGPDSTLWYSLNAAGSGQVNINTEGSDYDTVLAVYTGTQLNDLVEVGCDDDGGTGLLSDLDLNVIAGTAYYIQVGGYRNLDDEDNYVNDRGRLVLNVTAPLTTPVLVSPADASTTITETQPDFTWNGVVTANVYDLEVDDNSDFSSPEFTTTTSATSAAPGLALYNGTYFWRVRARNAAETTPWSDVWSVTIDVERFVDLVIDKIATPDPVIVGDPYTYAITITNNGPDDAQNVVVVDNFPLGVILDGSSASQGNCTSAPRLVTCNLGNLRNGDNATITLNARSVISESIFNEALVSSDATENDPNNNRIEIKTIINPPPGTRMIRWAGIDWYVKAADSPVGPGPNRFSDDEDSVWVDSNGNLHLKIVKDGANWYSAEIFSVERTSYGMHRAYVDSSINDLNENVVFGFFLYQDDEHEIDFEGARWGDPFGPNAQFALQPWQVPGNRERFFINDSGPTLHEIDWQAGQVDFRSLYGHDPSGGTLIHDYMIDSGVPVEERDLRIRLNLWLLNPILNPQNLDEVEIVIYDLDSPITDAQADLAVTKTTAQPYASAGQNLTYQLRVTNNGLDRAKDIVLTDTLPGDATFVSAEPAGLCNHAAGTVTCDLGDLGPGKWRNINLNVTVSGAASGILSNTASVTSVVPDLVSANDNVTLELPILATLSPPILSPPTVLSANQIQLNWADGAPGQTDEFYVERSADGNDPWYTIRTLPRHVTSFVDSNLLCGTDYWYRVRAGRVVDGAISDPSNVQSASTLACPAPVLHTAGVFTTGRWLFWDALNDGPPDLVFDLGPTAPGWTAVVGDWDGDGTDGIGLYKDGVWLLREVAAGGPVERQVQYGSNEPGWLPIVGDWNGDGIDGIGLYKDGYFNLRHTATAGSPNWTFEFGPHEPGWRPVASDWNGSGQDTIGLFKDGLWLLSNSTPARADLPPITFGNGGQPVAGDWNEDGTDGIGIFVDGVWYLRHTATTGAPEVVFDTHLSTADWQPLASYRGGIGTLVILSQPITDAPPPTQESTTVVPVTDAPEVTEAPVVTAPPEATAEVTDESTPETPTDLPAEVTAEPTVAPTSEPTEAPPVSPTIEPTIEPTVTPTAVPTAEPTESPPVETTEEPA